MRPLPTLQILNLDTAANFHAISFPAEIEIEARANWQPQNVTHSTKPLLYGNNDPKRISFNGWLDGTGREIRESIREHEQALFNLMTMIPGKGRPPALLLIYGDESFRCVLESVNVRQEHFDPDGTPIRAEVSLTFLELQPESNGQTGASGQSAQPAQPPRTGGLSGRRDLADPPFGS